VTPGEQDRSDDPPVPHFRHSPEGHLCLTYRGDSPPWKPIFLFLTAGLAANGRLLYVCHRTDPAEVERRLREANLNVEGLRTSGQLQFASAEEYYLPDGTFDPARMIENARLALEAARQDGFESLHIVGETGWTVDRDIPAEAIADYERRVAELLRRERIDALCLYPADRFEDPVLDELSEMHDGRLGTAGTGRSLEGGNGASVSDAEGISRETTFRRLPEALLHVRWPEGLIQACNGAAETYTGYARRDLIGSVLERLIADEEDAEEFRRRCREALEQGESPRITAPIRRADGESLLTEHVLMPLGSGPSAEGGPALLLMREAPGDE